MSSLLLEYEKRRSFLSAEKQKLLPRLVRGYQVPLTPPAATSRPSFWEILSSPEGRARYSRYRRFRRDKEERDEFVRDTIHFAKLLTYNRPAMLSANDPKAVEEEKQLAVTLINRAAQLTTVRRVASALAEQLYISDFDGELESILRQTDFSPRFSPNPCPI